MSDLIQKPRVVKYNGKTYEILFTIEAVDRIEDETKMTSNDILDVLKNPTKDRNTKKDFLRLAEILMNLSAEKENIPKIEEGSLARSLTPSGMLDLLKAMIDAARESFFVREDEEENDDPNQNRASQ